MKAFKVATTQRVSGLVPLEAINILLVLGEVGRGEALVHKAISDFCEPVEELGYFEIVSYLFCVKDDAAFSNLRKKLFDRANTILLDGRDLRIDAQAAFLSLNILSCPYIARAERAELFMKLRDSISLGPISLADATVVVESFETTPWFVQWGDANLLHMTRKKELSAVY